jgi:hypothetical protein
LYNPAWYGEKFVAWPEKLFQGYTLSQVGNVIGLTALAVAGELSIPFN